MNSASRAAWVKLLDARLRSGRSELISGRVASVQGGLIEACVSDAVVGQLCEIEVGEGSVLAEVVGLEGERARLLPWGSSEGVGVGARVRVRSVPGGRLRVEEALGRVLNGLGEPVDGGAVVARESGAPSGLFLRRSVGVADRFETGVAGIDALAPIGRGARVAIIGEAGSGKTYLLRQLRERMVEDVVVIGLVGERAREASSLVEEVFGGPLAGRVTVVVARSEAPASERVAAAELASELADSWRGRGRSCLLLLDSLTRYARALREVAQVRGEPLGASGFPVTMGSSMARLLERAGAGLEGSVTGLYSVLASSEQEQGVVAEEVRSLVDVQLVLRRRLADRGQFPAVDWVASMSRLSDDLLTAGELEVGRVCRGGLGLLEQHRDAVELGYYRSGSRPSLDAAISEEEALRRALTGGSGDGSWSELASIAARLRR
ncbi:MAG: flagellum-specific ATP synthase FliI [Deltaproteobacteria bacterium]|nr:flagellum-specific ATP synthase FliI [Deltaproteobacteria bacterium]